MKQILIGLFTGVLILTACAQMGTVTPIVITQAATATPSPTPTDTITTTPTETPTASITPLPTIPTFTPTFDARTILTVTPAAKAECPVTIPYPNPNLDLRELMESGSYEDDEEAILWFLNRYDPQPLMDYASDSWGNSEEYTAYQDFTNDGLPELAMGSFTGISITAFYIFGCKDGQYKQLLYIPSNGLSGPPTFVSIEDHNRNGLPELTLLTGFLSQGGHYYEVYEWDGDEFLNLIASADPNHPEYGALWVEATGQIHYEDLDNDLVQELILDSGIPVWETYYAGLPWRNERVYYEWNGQKYVPAKKEFAPPEFRFQAVQDGDLATTQLEFDKALGLYQAAIFDDILRGYSPEIRENLRAAWELSFGENPPPSPTPYPIDPNEYPKLASYGYYRIMLLHLAQQQELDAGTTYNTLQEKFGNDSYGRPYVEMATVFWNAYQSTHKMYDACAGAIEFAAEHPEILIPLGSDYHGWQSHIYVPADVCPFR